jgi:N-acetylglucosamine-6-phosphate deacetylase
LVSFNSDSSDHARRLNLEAAKAVKYGGTTEEEALQFVTLNPARQLRIDARVGSLEPDKDADFAIWSGSPLSAQSICLQTWIEGVKYFDRDAEQHRVAALEAERKAILEHAQIALRQSGEAPGREAEKRSFLERAFELEHDGHDRHCLEDDR